MTKIVIQGGGVRADWLFVGAVGVGVAVVLLWRQGSRFRDDLASVILAVERCEGAGNAVKRKIAVRSARRMGLGRMVRRVTRSREQDPETESRIAST